MNTNSFVKYFHNKQQADIYSLDLWMGLKFTEKTKITYNFINHFHPYVGYLIERLNEGSVPGLLDSVTQQKSEDFFEDTYKPNTFDPTLAVNYGQKDIDLSMGGSYSVYNWELFFHVPLTIAIHLSKNQRFADAQQWFHFIFNPTSNEKKTDPPERFWNFRAFSEKTDIQLIDDMLRALSEPEDENTTEEELQLKENLRLSIEAWRNKPFQPHVVGRMRPLAYQLNVVMKYLDNLIAWGDSLFRQDTIETLNEATQIFVLVANILGQKPQEVPRRGVTKPATYATLRGKLDVFGNALVEMEGQVPFNLSMPTTENQDTDQSNSLFGVGRMLYFCIPKNDKLLGYWDTVADRLFKIRHCMNIEGVVRHLPLFQPPIDPGMLVKAAAAGIDLNSVVSGLNQPVSTVRSIVLIQRATEICNEVRSLGNALLSAIEKNDGETLSLLRQEQEIKILRLVEDVRFLQWKESENATDSLIKSRESAFQRYRHYQILLGKKEEDLSDIKELTLERREIDQENFDEIYGELVGQFAVEIELEDYPAMEHLGEGTLNLNWNEFQDLNVHMPEAREKQDDATDKDELYGTLGLLPSIGVDLHFWGLGGRLEFGGPALSSVGRILAGMDRANADKDTFKGIRSSKTSTFERRAEDWILQSNLAAQELMQIGTQIISSLIREQITQKEYQNHKVQIENAVEIDTFLKEKFSNKELYTWMQGEISKIYYECYKFAYDIAKKTEQTMKHEVMRKELDERDFIKFNYWDAGRKGLLSGEALYLDIKRMEMAYHDHNKREYELTKHISLQQLDPIALLQLKATGSCEITIPEWLFDLDCPGHYMRRIKTLSVSIPCVVGPYTSVNCTLSLQKSILRRSPLLKDGDYSRDGSEDERFRDYFGTIQSIVTSNAQSDTGIFELNLRDERFLPFEGAGAESTWKLELPSEYRQFDYDTISDVILHMRYTARQGGASLKEEAEKQIKALVEEMETTGLFRLFSLKHDFPNEWHKFISSDSTENFKATIKKEYFSYIAQGFKIEIDQNQIQLLSINKDLKIIPADSSSVIIDTDQFNETGEGTIEILENSIDRDAQVFIVLRYTIT